MKRKEGEHAFTAEELEAMRIADEEIEREYEESYSAQYADAGISKWLDELAVKGSGRSGRISST